MGFQKAAISVMTKLLAAKSTPGTAAATMGTQTLYCGYQKLVRILLKHGLTPAALNDPEDLTYLDQLLATNKEEADSSLYLRLMGFRDIISLDIFPTSRFSLVQDLGAPIPESLQNRFDLLLDGSTGHHIFDTVQYLRNVTQMLRIGGTVFHSVLLDPLLQSASFMNLHSLVQFYAHNGFSDCRAFFCSLHHQNNIFEIAGDPYCLMDFHGKEDFYLLVAATKTKDVPFTSRIFSLRYELDEQLPHEPATFRKRLAGKRVAVWGTSGHYRDHYRSLVVDQGREFEMLGFVDSNKDTWGTQVDGHTVHSPDDLATLAPDVVLLASWQKTSLFQALCRKLAGRPQTIKHTYDLYALTFRSMDVDDIYKDFNITRGFARP